MKITIMRVTAIGDLARVPGLVREYRDAGYADGSRPRQRDCVLYGRFDTAAVWGGPDHIRIAFSATEGSTS